MTGQARNVLLIVLDTVRANCAYPETSAITPTIRRVASSGAQFTQAISPYPWSLAAHASMYTGRYATEHGATHEHRVLSEDVPVLAEQLNEAGFRTGVFTGNLYLTESFGMRRGFDEWDFMQGRGSQLFAGGFNPRAFLARSEFDGPKEKYLAVARRVAEGPALRNALNAAYFKFVLDPDEGDLERSTRWDRQALSSAKEFVRRSANRGDRFFGVVNFLGAHAPWPYDPDRLEAVGVEPTDFAPADRWEWVAERSAAQWPFAAGDVEFNGVDRTMLRHLYRAWVHEVDGLAGELLATLDAAGVREETLCIVTSDHGEMVAEDGVLGHNVVLDRPVVRVPLAVDGPTVERSVHTRPVSLKDVYGTVLARTGVDPGHRRLVDPVDAVLSETYGADPERVARVDETYPGMDRVNRFFQRRRALFTGESRVERRSRGGKVVGDRDVVDALDAFVSDLHVAEGVDDAVAVGTDVRDRLRHLGYAE